MNITHHVRNHSYIELTNKNNFIFKFLKKGCETQNRGQHNPHV